jgi:hypothetical protein
MWCGNVIMGGYIREFQILQLLTWMRGGVGGAYKSWVCWIFSCCRSW